MKDLSQEQLEDVTGKVNKLYYEMAKGKRSLSMLTHLYTTLRSAKDRQSLLDHDIPDLIKQIHMVETAMYYWQRIVNKEIQDLLFDHMLELLKKRTGIDPRKASTLALIINVHCNGKK